MNSNQFEINGCWTTLTIGQTEPCTIKSLRRVVLAAALLIEDGVQQNSAEDMSRDAEVVSHPVSPPPGTAWCGKSGEQIADCG